MDAPLVIFLVLTSAVVLALALSNYLKARRALLTAQQKAKTAQDGFLELKSAVAEFESWASDYLAAASKSITQTEANPQDSTSLEMPARFTGAEAAHVDWRAFLPALVAASEKFESGQLDEHLLLLLRWEMASNNKEAARWYANELRGASVTDVACRWLFQDSDDWNYRPAGGIPARTAAYLKGAIQTRDLAATPERPELAF
ncbi:hypothetical protein QFZ23_003653 [Arthrobacter globiformis]|uniref:hypothetical protein n=1 Tax=Arthrobacter globiformis TaxID=1665 RepID=UPI0027849C3B|nr:hypothetical protein [Arthrobacter globiformis]MDQ1059752.1 hypothetical protein [Arthrobacter globiformis]